MINYFDEENIQSQDESNALVVSSPVQTRISLLNIEAELLGELARSADEYVRNNVFTERQQTKAWNSVRKEIAALSNFMQFLQESADLSLSFHLAEEPHLWQAITFGLVKLYLRWMQLKGYRIKTINDHLDVIKLYARLAHDAGFQTADQLISITNIPRIRGAQAERIDIEREQQEIPTHVGHKKPEPTFLEQEEFQALLERPDTPQGWRDLVAVLLMYDLSLRPSEAVSLKLKDLNMEERTLRITRHKTHDQAESASDSAPTRGSGQIFKCAERPFPGSAIISTQLEKRKTGRMDSTCGPTNRGCPSRRPPTLLTQQAPLCTEATRFRNNQIGQTEKRQRRRGALDTIHYNPRARQTPAFYRVEY